MSRSTDTAASNCATTRILSRVELSNQNNSDFQESDNFDGRDFDHWNEDRMPEGWFDSCQRALTLGGFDSEKGGAMQRRVQQTENGTHHEAREILHLHPLYSSPKLCR